MVRPALSIAMFLIAWMSPIVSAQETGGSGLRTEVPLHEQIDQEIEAAAIGPLAPICSDADFLRRIHLDLTGMIPTADQVQAFLVDSNPNKREVAIDALIASPDFTRHMAIELTVILLERRNDKTANISEWERYLMESIASNKPLDQLYRELVFYDGDEGPALVPAKFVLNRDAEPNAVTRDVGRLAFGMDLQCAQCHNHPLVEDYLQEDYYGLYAFWHRTSLFTDPKSKALKLSEKADGEASFKSVFTGFSRDQAWPRLPKGKRLETEPWYPESDSYLVKPDKDRPGRPKFSRREALARMLAENPQFHRNVANRLWNLMLGRGIVHPVDLHHSSNPPSNPHVLKLLSEEVVKHRFQLKPLLRSLALTRTYQRSCDTPNDATINFVDIEARSKLLAQEIEERRKPLEALREMTTKTKASYEEAVNKDAEALAQLPAARKTFDSAKGKLDQSISSRKKMEEARTRAKEQADAIQTALTAVKEAAAKLPDDKGIAEIVSKVGAKAKELEGALASAEKKFADAQGVENTSLASFESARKSLEESERKRVATSALASLEQSYLEASARFEDSDFEIKALEGRFQLCKNALEYAAVRRVDPAKAEAIWQSLVQQWTIYGQLAPLKAMTPEQMAMSAMRATGVLDAQWKGIQAKLEKSPPDALKKAEGEEKTRLQLLFEQSASIDQLRDTFNQFVSLYGGLPGEDFQATVNQALFFGNGSIIDGWLKPSGDNLMQRLLKKEDPREIAHELYLSMLSRPPSEIEQQEVVTGLKGESDKRLETLRELCWAILSSNEFRFNH